MPDLLHRAVALLHECDPVQKAAQTLKFAKDWQSGHLAVGTTDSAPKPPIEPGRPSDLQTVNPGAVPRRRIGTLEGRIALLHAIAHIELNAIDLALDLLARFTFDPAISKDKRHAFITDWVMVASDEARHFTMLNTRLIALDSHYGALGVHHGLWEAAQNTADDLAARLAIAPMLLEARGLDVTPPMIEKLQSANDKTSAAILQTIYEEEIAHVAKGVYWFKAICTARGQMSPHVYFQDLVQKKLPAGLRPPFNDAARARAGLSRDYYQNDTC